MDTEAQVVGRRHSRSEEGPPRISCGWPEATGLLAALTANACSRADRCDADTVTDLDVRDPPNRPTIAVIRTDAKPSMLSAADPAVARERPRHLSVGHCADGRGGVPGALLRTRRLPRPARRSVIFRWPPLDRSSRSRPHDRPREASRDHAGSERKDHHLATSTSTAAVASIRSARRGCSVRARRSSSRTCIERIPSLGRLCEALERAFSSRMQTNIYLTPPVGAGLRAALGHARRLHPADRRHQALDDLRHEDPAAAAEPAFRSHRRLPGPISMEFMLEAGDACYIPRGAIHAAQSSDDTSLHITTGLIGTTGPTCCCRRWSPPG